MGRAFVDMTGQRFGMLTVWYPVECTNSGKMWMCRCDCGNVLKVLRGNLLKGAQTSCGCYRDSHRAEIGALATRHGHAAIRSGAYRSWMAMNQRCNNPNSDEYFRYGARGVTICIRWQVFENFLADMGERPIRKTLDRYPNNEGNYEPSNCRWATISEQNKNRRKRIC